MAEQERTPDGLPIIPKLPPSEPAEAQMSSDEADRLLSMEVREVNAKFPTDGGWHLDVKLNGEIVPMIGKEMGRWFKEKGGVNYVEMKMLDPTNGEMYVLTCQRANGKTPHELRVEAEAKVAAVRTETIREVREKVERMERHRPFVMQTAERGAQAYMAVDDDNPEACEWINRKWLLANLGGQP